MVIAPLTKLDAINEIIGAMGEAPVDTLEDNENVDVMNALRMLEAGLKEIQVNGWTFNTINDFVLTPDEDTKHILWDNTILHIQFSEKRIVRKRGDYLYDVTNNTYQL